MTSRWKREETEKLRNPAYTCHRCCTHEECHPPTRSLARHAHPGGRCATARYHILSLEGRPPCAPPLQTVHHRSRGRTKNGVELSLSALGGGEPRLPAWLAARRLNASIHSRSRLFFSHDSPSITLRRRALRVEKRGVKALQNSC